VEGLTEARIVHYVLPRVGPDGRHPHRPAIVVNVINKETGMVNLQVFEDGTNDDNYDNAPRWVTSVAYSEQALEHTWHWPERA
jgi:hypothetical protein